MQGAMSFLRSLVVRAVVQHRRFCAALELHREPSADRRLRELCERFSSPMHVHQRALEAYGESIDSGAATRAAIDEAGIDAGVIPELADVRSASDFDRLSSDLLMSRQALDTFMLFRDGARILGDTELERTGDLGAREHSAFARAASRLLLRMFVEKVDGAMTLAADEAQPDRSEAAESGP